MTFKETIQKLTPCSEWETLIDSNFNRRANVYQYLMKSDYSISVDNQKLKLPSKIVFCNGYERFRSVSSKETIIEYKSKKIVVNEKTHIIPFGLYERKFKYSGSTAQILKDVVGEELLSCMLSDNLLEVGNYPLYGIDSKLEYPSYLLLFEKMKSNSKQKTNIDLDTEEFKSVMKDILMSIGINYEIDNINSNLTYVIFPLPYVQIIENRLNTKDEKEKVTLTLKFNSAFYNVFRQNEILIDYEIKELNGEETEKSKMKIDFERGEIMVVNVCPQKIKKIGLCKFKILINKVEVNHFSGTYIRSIQINTKIVEK